MSHRHQIQGFRIPNMATHHIKYILTQHYVPRKDTKNAWHWPRNLSKKRIGFLFFITTFFGGFFRRTRPGFYRLFRVFL